MNSELEPPSEKRVLKVVLLKPLITLLALAPLAYFGIDKISSKGFRLILMLPLALPLYLIFKSKK